MKDRWNDIQEYHRQYVDVLAVHTKDGRLLIKAIYWPDGRMFRVERTIGGPYAKSPYTGAPGKRYTIFINGKKREIYQQKDRFFVDVRGSGGVENTWELSDEDWDDIERNVKNTERIFR